jgi:MFS family permease
LHLQIPPALFHRRFRLLWLGLMISVAGSQMQIWALFWHIRDLTDQPIALGMVGLARILPVVIFSLVAGALADTVNRRKLMFITQTAQALVAVLLGALTIRGAITLGMIYLLTAIQAVAVAFDLPARQALVPNLVPPKDLPNAFSLNSIAQQVGSIVGPALSGLVIASLGQSAVYLINAITFLAVLIALVMMGPVAQQAPAGAKPALNRKGIQEGIHFIINQPIILSTMIMDFFATFFSSANTLMPLYARDVLHVGVIQYGWLSAAQSIGAVGAALVISQVSIIRKQGPLFLLSVAAFGISTILFGLSRSFLMAIAALILIGASDSVSTIIRNTIRQLQTPDYIRGRMTSINQIFFMGGPQFGEVEAGLVAQLFTTPIAIVSGGIGCLVALALIIKRWPQLRTYNGEEASQPAVAS